LTHENHVPTAHVSAVFCDAVGANWGG
jgi:hypothetical protein